MLARKQTRTLSNLGLAVNVRVLLRLARPSFHVTVAGAARITLYPLL